MGTLMCGILELLSLQGSSCLGSAEVRLWMTDVTSEAQVDDAHTVCTTVPHLCDPPRSLAQANGAGDGATTAGVAAACASLANELVAVSGPEFTLGSAQYCIGR